MNTFLCLPLSRARLLFWNSSSLPDISEQVSHRDRHGRVIATQLPTTDDGRGLEEGEEEDEGHRCYSTLQESDGSAVVVSGVAEGGAGNRGLEFARDRLQEYVLMCSQQVDGGLRDKPGK